MSLNYSEKISFITFIFLFTNAPGLFMLEHIECHGSVCCLVYVLLLALTVMGLAQNCITACNCTVIVTMSVKWYSGSSTRSYCLPITDTNLCSSSSQHDNLIYV